MATKQQVIDLNKKHPEWTASDIASELDCMVEYVGACKKRYGLRFAKATHRADHPNSVLALGRAARRAGLTVEKLQQMGRSA